MRFISWKARPWFLGAMVGPVLLAFAFVLPNGFSLKKQELSKFGVAKVEIRHIDVQIERFQADCGRYPINREGLSALLGQPAGATGWKGPYLSEMPSDPWGEPYVYVRPGEHNKEGFDLYSQDHETGDWTANNWSE